MPKYELYTRKKKESNNFNRLQIEVFFLPNISPPPPPTPPAPKYQIYAHQIYPLSVLTGFYGIFNLSLLMVESDTCDVKKQSSNLIIQI